jgi:hypothetical protein|tara:strand:+ start:250 stop:465 length:216 start_codon:yes stop_codon:yes gene_type:complete
MERKIIILLTLILICIGATSCAKPKVNNDPVEEENIPTVQRLESIANVLGCMFDPTPCQDKKDLGKTEEGK